MWIRYENVVVPFRLIKLSNTCTYVRSVQIVFLLFMFLDIYLFWTRNWGEFVGLMLTGLVNKTHSKILFYEKMIVLLEKLLKTGFLDWKVSFQLIRL